MEFRIDEELIENISQFSSSIFSHLEIISIFNETVRLLLHLRRRLGFEESCEHSNYSIRLLHFEFTMTIG